MHFTQLTHAMFCFSRLHDVMTCEQTLSCGFNNNLLKLMRCFNSFVMRQRFEKA